MIVIQVKVISESDLRDSAISDSDISENDISSATSWTVVTVVNVAEISPD